MSTVLVTDSIYGKFIGYEKVSKLQDTARILLGVMLAFAGVSHLTFARRDFQAQVPDWVPLDKDLTVVLSGGVEISLGLALVLLRRYRKYTGLVAALFFFAVFPGNISQYTHHRDAFGLDTDTRRLVRLFFQPVLILWALYASGILDRKSLKGF
ncbi:MAG: DoxX family membrane protein [Rikenellaceae bacterium]|nr:DoxX family membrane protein [Rikenellaceae bacterium]